MRHLPTRGFKTLAAIALLAGVAVAGPAMASNRGATGLGQAWPNAQDVSSSPRWHVYVFERDGIRYIQINDLNGNVRAAFATQGGSFLVLPIGSDASRLATPQDPQPAPADTQGEIVYRDSDVQLQVTPQASGMTTLQAVDATCSDPVECSSRVN
ncbi:hypothetical protein RKE25_13655 [Dyella sp. BiH032]|uniref:hypothetical protein n=1 Tax=Dyella sp. BiH032 TaxID=3075430 RepID=UPI002892E41F|nr:hypothetical protein [Dyella sp. BiH032]WNL44475.1 hypothetical protein RKE25_13655 [Dyella sp. BiH032]